MTTPTCAGASTTPAITEVPSKPSLATFDPAAFAGILPPEMGVNSVFGRHVLGLFVKESAKLVESVEHAAHRGDAQTALWVAHSLKSTGGSVGALAFADIAREIELRARTGTTATLDDLPASLRQAYERFCTEPAVCEVLAEAAE